MTPLQEFQRLDRQLESLLPPLRGLEHSLDKHLATLLPGTTVTTRTVHFGRFSLLQLIGLHLFDGGTFRLPPDTQARHEDHPQLALPSDFAARINSICSTLRQDMHARLAVYWLEQDPRGLSRVVRLSVLRREQLLTEMQLRGADATLSPEHVRLLTTCIEHPYPWQRAELPEGSQPQLYRPLLSTAAPNWRSYLPGLLVIMEQGPQGRLVDAQEQVGKVLLCSLAHGIEAFDSLADLHVELCERLEDPLQSAPLLNSMVNPDDQQRARCAERLRYDWYPEDLALNQAMEVRDAQIKRLSLAWQTAWKRGVQRDIEQLDAELAKALDLRTEVGSQGILATRYGLLLEKHLPNWLLSTSQQGVAHIMQAMQEQVMAIEAAAGPGILSLGDFQQRHSLLSWVRLRMGEFLRRDPGIDVAPEAIYVSVTLARQVGAIVNPLPGSTSGFVPVSSRRQTGGTIELVQHTYRLDELALLNIAWFDVDYWLTAHVHLENDTPLPALTPLRVKQIIRRLNAGSGYQAYLQTQLLDSPQGQWRQQAYAQLQRTRMNAEAVKARYAGHFFKDHTEQGYNWANTAIQWPDSHSRPHKNGQQVIVRQMLVQGQTLQGVLLLVSPENSLRIVVYSPDAPDRRYWREYRNPRELIRAVRSDEALRRYVIQRLPLGNGNALDKLLRKGRLGSYIELQTITANLYEALYRAEVKSLMAQANLVTRSEEELLGEFSVNLLRLLLDIVTLVLPKVGTAALSFGRMGISIWDGLDALEQDDRNGALHHAVAALGHAGAGINEVTGSGLIRRVMRGLPKPPPLPLPKQFEVAAETEKLRYQLDASSGEAVYEKTSASQGLSLYYVKDNLGRYYNVSFDGTRWRATDPNQPSAYLKLPIKRCQDGRWVIDSPLRWFDGLPDIKQLLDDCRLTSPLPGTAVENEPQLYEHDTRLYLQFNIHQLPVRRHLLSGHYHLLIPENLLGAVPAWAVMRRHDQLWQIRVRQTGRSSDWLALPDDYSDNLGSNLSSR